MLLFGKYNFLSIFSNRATVVKAFVQDILSFVMCDIVITAMLNPAVQRTCVALQMLLLSICTVVDCIRVDKLQLSGMEGAPTPQDHQPAVGKNQYLIVNAYCALDDC